MYHENHPDGGYEMANQVLAFEPPRVISWKPGYVSPEVTLSYDWSAVGPAGRQRVPFPPFSPDHLDNSLSHLAVIVAR
jgi:hypothetical protein